MSGDLKPMRVLPICILVLVAAGCASAPPAAAPAPPPKAVDPRRYEQKVAAMLRLEDQRILREPAPSEPPAPRGRAGVAPPPVPEFIRLLTDEEARVRRRAALAIGHVGLSEGVAPLVTALGDAEPEVRQMAAFALGLIADKAARDPLMSALADASPLVRGSAAEALGLLGDPAAADAVAGLAYQVVQSGALAQIPGDEEDLKRDTPAASFRLAIYALVRLKAYPQMAGAILDSGGQPRVRWWPVAYALQRIEDPRALPALLTLAKEANPYTRAFAVKGLGGLKDRQALPVLMPLLSSGTKTVLVEAIRALGRIGDPSSVDPLLKVINDATTDPQVRLEAVTALGAIRATTAPAVLDRLMDMLTDSSPPMRAAALRAIAAWDPEQLVAVLSTLDPDPHWSVRAQLATVLGGMNTELGAGRLEAMLKDSDQRVVPSVLEAMVKMKMPTAAAALIDQLKADDAAVRSAAARGVAELKPANGAAALAEAYAFGQRDSTHSARASALDALAKYGAESLPTLRAAFADKDWAVRVRAAQLVKELDPSGDDPAMQIRPAPTTFTPEQYDAARLLNPPVSTQVYLDTDRGTIQIELAVVDAPLTVENFVALAKKGYFTGLSVHRVVPDFVIQDGDPRSDGEGGPGYSIRDELSERPYLRGTVGMALDAWRDTGGSQYFITISPQPHLDAKYTVFGRVLAGMDVVDRIQQWDVIRKVRVWDGETMTEK
jgi:HEAT repeat protein/cyclophilin family peptidyl-prolyl cis-trans isomerase